MNQEKPRLIDANALDAKLAEISSLMARRSKEEDPGFLAVGAGITLAQAELDAIPTIEPVRHAHWETNPSRCSACKGDQPMDSWDYAIDCPWCPYCGAKMDEEENT